MTRRTRQVGTVVLTAAAIAYLFWKVELETSYSCTLGVPSTTASSALSTPA